MTELNILQINIRGLISRDTQDRKCPLLNHIMITKQIDIVLIQEWCATKREEVANPGTDSISDDQNNPNSPSILPRLQCPLSLYRMCGPLPQRPKYNTLE